MFPQIGDRPVAGITPADILAVVQPLWFTKPNLAQRILQWLESVFKSAILRGQRASASPCVGVGEVLGARRREVEHRAALPYRQLPAFVRELRAGQARPVVKLCVEWAVLTAVRSAEARGARWSEINGAWWTIPRERMRKTGVAHVVPLSGRSLQILQGPCLEPQLRPDLPRPGRDALGRDPATGGSPSRRHPARYAQRVQGLGGRDRRARGGRRGRPSPPRANRVRAAYCARASRSAPPVMQAWADHCEPD